MHITVEGNSTTRAQLESALEEAGISTRYAGPPLFEQRGTGQQALQWFKLYLAEKGADVATGGRVEAGLRIAADRAVREFKERYPHLRISVDRDEDDP